MEISRIDRISELPLELKAQILSELPLQEAVRSCIFSRAWKGVWREVTSVFIDDRVWDDISNLPSLINMVLPHLNQGLITKFKICLVNRRYPIQDVAGWLDIAVHSNLNDLCIDICDTPVRCPQRAFCIPTLTRLFVHLHSNFEIPTYFNLTLLTQLELQSITFEMIEDRDCINIMAPSMEVLVLSRCNFVRVSTILLNAPKLRHLHIASCVGAESFCEIRVNAPLLTEIFWIDNKNPITLEHSTIVHTVTIIVSSSARAEGRYFFYLNSYMPSVKELTLASYAVKCLEDNALQFIENVFTNLKKLVLHPVPKLTWKDTTVRFLRVKFLASQLISQLLIFQISGIIGSHEEFLLLKHVLELAPELEAMEIEFDGLMLRDEVSDFISDLQIIPSAAVLRFNFPCYSS